MLAFRERLVLSDAVGRDYLPQVRKATLNYGRRRNIGGDDIIGGINVTPLVDIMWSGYFHAHSQHHQQSSDSGRSAKAATGEGTEPTMLALTLTENGTIFLNGEATTKPALIEYLPEVAKADDQAQALIAADKSVPHGQVIEIIDLVRQMGIYRFALNIDPNQPPIKMGTP